LGDDSEDRSTAFFQRHLLVDFEQDYREKTFLVKDKDFPFGFEYIPALASAKSTWVRLKPREIPSPSAGTSQIPRLQGLPQLWQGNAR
jgi:hypothetical protein